MFCSLNLGVSGVIKDDESIKNIKDNFKSIGDIVKVQVTGFEKSGKIVLKYAEQSINCLSQTNPPQVFVGNDAPSLPRPMTNQNVMYWNNNSHSPPQNQNSMMNSFSQMTQNMRKNQQSQSNSFNLFQQSFNSMSPQQQM